MIDLTEGPAAIRNAIAKLTALSPRMSELERTLQRPAHCGKGATERGEGRIRRARPPNATRSHRLRLGEG